ncbi:MAG: fibronectin type III domain-containing protein [Propionibacteriaceae bacterium]|nr:fibronectin type III domain-containing protein [Propionibacteriaceae bacterium]
MKSVMRFVLGLALALGLAFGMPAAPAQAAYSAPSGLKAVSVSQSSVSLWWKPVTGAPKYVVQYSKSSSMSNPLYQSSAESVLEISTLASSTTYYLRVAVADATGTAVSSYSSKVKITTKTSYKYLAPNNLRVTEEAGGKVKLAWDSRGSGLTYHVSYAKKSSFSGAKSAYADTNEITLDGLANDTTYYFRVRVVDSAKKALSAYAPKISRKTTWKYAAPTGLITLESAQTKVVLSWPAVAGAEKYRVQVGKSAKMSGAKYVKTTDHTVTITGLTANKTYWFKVRVITAGGDNRSPYSAAIQAKTPKASDSKYLPPTLTASNASKHGYLKVDWSSSGSGLYYQLQYSGQADMSTAKSIQTKSRTAELKYLGDDADYYLRVRVVSSKGAAQSQWRTLTARTLDEDTTPLIVASYNVRCSNCYSKTSHEAYEEPWENRRDYVVDTVKNQHPDVIGFQEAAQAWLKDENGKTYNKSQFEDLVERLGSPYKLTNTHRNNCVKSTTPTGCVYKDQGASQGTKIVYNSSTLTMLSAGSKRLPEIILNGSNPNDRYVAWAVFEQKQTGKRFFFADIHNENCQSCGGSSWDLDIRNQQVEAALAEIAKQNKDNLPVYFVGDFNASKQTKPSNVPYELVNDFGLIDSLGNPWGSTTEIFPDVLSSRIHSNYDSYGGFKSLKPTSRSWVNGSNLDYIFISPEIDAQEWETVVNLDGSGKWAYPVIPSDHNMIRLTSVLPKVPAQ